jgi:hypothetical protein
MVFSINSSGKKRGGWVVERTTQHLFKGKRPGEKIRIFAKMKA